MDSTETCRGCNGSGRLETECCSGAGGCDCRGQIVDLGDCRACGGSGEIEEGTYDREANLSVVRGLHFVGSGPSYAHDVWPNRGGMVRP